MKCTNYQLHVVLLSGVVALVQHHQADVSYFQIVLVQNVQQNLTAHDENLFKETQNRVKNLSGNL